MTGYDWCKQAERLARENADLRRQVDQAHAGMSIIGRAALDQGVKLRDHDLELRAIELFHQARADALERFRKTVVVSLVDAEDAIEKRGADPAQVFRVLKKGLYLANQRAKDAARMQQARERAERELFEATVPDEPTLFEVGG